MKCPICGNQEYTVHFTKKYDRYIYRRRECKECLTRFTTREIIMINSIPKELLDRVKP